MAYTIEKVVVNNASKSNIALVADGGFDISIRLANAAEVKVIK
jgi:hypothetical protein